MKDIIALILYVLIFASCMTRDDHSPGNDKAVVFKDWTLNLEDMTLTEDPGKEPLDIVWEVGEEPRIWDETGGNFSGDSFIIHYQDGNILGQVFARPVMEDSNTITGSMIVLKDPTGNKVLWTYNPDPPLFYGRSMKIIFDEESSRLYIAIFHPIATGSGLVCLDSKTGNEIWNADVEQLLIGHSRYKNEVFIKLIDDRIVMAGDELGGCYLQVFDYETGERLFSEINRTW